MKIIHYARGAKVGFPPLLVLAMLVLALPAGAQGRQQAVVTALEGQAWAISADGERRLLHPDMAVFPSDTVETGPDSQIVLTFDDDSRFELGADAAMLVRQYVFKPRDPESRLVTRILRGAFRFVSGAIARLRGEGMRVELSVATIGIRGTRVGGEADATSARVMLLEPEDDPARYTAIEVSNSFGSVVVDKPGWGTEVPDQHSAPSPPRRMQLDSINRLNRSMQTLRRVITPRIRPGM